MKKELIMVGLAVGCMFMACKPTDNVVTPPEETEVGVKDMDYTKLDSTTYKCWHYQISGIQQNMTSSKESWRWETESRLVQDLQATIALYEASGYETECFYEEETSAPDFESCQEKVKEHLK